MRTPENLDPVLANARRARQRLRTRFHVLVASGLAGALLLGLRGVVAVAWPARAASSALATGLALALLASAALVVTGLRLRPRLEDLEREVHVLELTREAVAHASAPVVVPYRAPSGERPLVLVPARDEEAPRPWPARVAAAALVVAAGGIALAALSGHGASPKRRWMFAEPGRVPESLGFLVTSPQGGTWRVEHDAIATGAASMVNRVGDAAAPPAVLVASGSPGRDVRVATRCRVAAAEGGACGVVFRHRDEGTHHVARLEADRGRVVLVRRSGGFERVLGVADAKVSASAWHELVVEARGDRVEVAVDGERRIEARDPLPSFTGHVGLWAPAGGEAWFDELGVEVFPASPEPTEILPLLRPAT